MTKLIVKKIFICCILILGLPGMSSCTVESKPLAEARTIPGADTIVEAADSPLAAAADSVSEETPAVFDPYSVPDYDGSSPYSVINNNIPYFSADEKTTDVFEIYSELDELGRCGVAYANICIDIMPTEERGEIGSIKPSGWQTVRYDDLIEKKYLYNRCHLIGYQLAGENANEKNLITGTRYMNVSGMLPFENQVASYVEASGNHVLYRVTPVFDGDNLVASGVLMEAWSVEDNGEGVCFNVFCYNVQPGIEIDYTDGSSWIAGAEYAASEISESIPNTETEIGTESGTESKLDSEDSRDQNRADGSSSDGSVVEIATDGSVEAAEASDCEESADPDYVLNTAKLKIHYPWCSSVDQMSDKNKEEYWGSIDALLEMGYTACGSCKPE